MSLIYNKNLISRAKKLRRDMTKQERHLWYDFLSRYPLRFQRQKTIGNYIVDFYCHKAKLVVELDGSQHFDDQSIIYDARRTAFLESLDLRVVRFLNRDVDSNFNEVCSTIKQTVGDA